jgi:hypothetical protein
MAETDAGLAAALAATDAANKCDPNRIEIADVAKLAELWASGRGHP